METIAFGLMFFTTFLIFIIGYLCFLLEYRKHQHKIELEVKDDTIKLCKEYERTFSKKIASLITEKEKLQGQLKFLSDRNIIVESGAGNVSDKYKQNSDVLITERLKQVWNNFLNVLQTSK